MKPQDPSPADIAADCLLIQSTWTPDERLRRLRVDQRPMVRLTDGRLVAMSWADYDGHQFTGMAKIFVKVLPATCHFHTVEGGPVPQTKVSSVRDFKNSRSGVQYESSSGLSVLWRAVDRVLHSFRPSVHHPIPTLQGLRCDEQEHFADSEFA